MITDDDLPLCDRTIFEEGETVLVTHSVSSGAMESWVNLVRQESGQPVDWFFSGGRAIVKAMGDVDRVRVVVEKLRPKEWA